MPATRHPRPPARTFGGSSTTGGDRPDRRSPWGPDAATATALVVTVALVWAALKVLSMWGWVLVPGEYGDTYYYFLSAESAAVQGGIAATLTEYPTPAGLLLLLPYEWGATHYTSYRAAILAMTTLADAAFALLLGRRIGPLAVLAWAAMTSALGQLALLRFDMLPAVAAGAAVLLAMQHRRLASAAFVALGTGLKLWPIVLLPLALDRRDHRRSLAAVAVLGTVGAVLVAGSVAVGGWARLFTPLSYQTGRGLQIEAVPATVPMAEWARDDAYRVWYSTFHAYEVTGPSVQTWLRIGQAASVVGVLACVALLAWWWLRGARAEAIGWLALAFVGTFIVTSRALSPQYLLWLAAPAAVIVGLALHRGREAPPLVPALATFAGVLVLCVLTTAVYPVTYGGVTGRTHLTDDALVLLVARNVGLLALVAWAGACAFVTSRSIAPARENPLLQ